MTTTSYLPPGYGHNENGERIPIEEFPFEGMNSQSLEELLIDTRHEGAAEACRQILSIILVGSKETMGRRHQAMASAGARALIVARLMGHPMLADKPSVQSLADQIGVHRATLVRASIEVRKIAMSSPMIAGKRGGRKVSS